MQQFFKMKAIKIILFAFLLFAVGTTNAQIGIGIANPAASAQLDVNSTTKGLLPPRMTQAQRNVIASPEAGLTIWCKDCGVLGELQVYNGVYWTNMVGGTTAAPTSSVTIGTQVWMTKNLDVVTYRNGDPIAEVTDYSQWGSMTTGAWCYYYNDPSYGPVYGKFYNWYAVNDPRGLAPAGWHIPSDAEWTTLIDYLGGETVAGGKMKEAGSVHWFAPNVGATNESGFTSLPGGQRSNNGVFLDAGSYGYWWSSSMSAGARWLYYNNASAPWYYVNKAHGFSARCIKD